MHISVPTPGTIVWIRQRRWRVEGARLDRNVVRLDVADREERLTFLTPFDRPTAVELPSRVRYVRPQQAMARLAGLIARTPTARATLSAVEARIDILPHQLEAVLAVLGGVRRLLIADEVGLGKTVQAGLIIAELTRRRPSIRALVIVPAFLRAQWTDELACRFGIRGEVADRHGLELAVRGERYGTNPWSRSGVWLASADYLKQRHVLDAMPLTPWDLVVIDEAHDACGDSERHAACDEIARRARHLVLLTATPHSGDPVRFARLERLGQLEGLGGADSLTVFRRTRATLLLPVSRRVRWHRIKLSQAETKVLDALGAFERAVLDTAGDIRRDTALLLLSVFRKRALSSMTALDLSLERRLSWIEGHESPYSLDWLQPPLEFEDSGDSRGDDDPSGLIAESGMRADHERAWIRRLRSLAQSARARESKIAWLANVVRRVLDPLVVFTEFRHSLISIERSLARFRRVAVLHGGQSLPERRLALEQFLNGEASVLVATDVAGQGLNLQTRARWVVSFELPWNPVRLEQRIGRVDRIGQLKPVHGTLLIARHIAEAGLLSRLAERALAARQSLGDDVFADTTLPAEHEVARTLLTGSKHEPATPSGVRAVPSQAWRRRACAVARQIVRRRAAGRCWRAPTDIAGRPCWTDGCQVGPVAIPLCRQPGPALCPVH